MSDAFAHILERLAQLGQGRPGPLDREQNEVNDTSVPQRPPEVGDGPFWPHEGPLSREEYLRRRTAVHEAGHAVAAIAIDLRVFWATLYETEIDGFGPTLGHVLVEQIDRARATDEKIRGMGVFALAGLAAEDVILGQRGMKWAQQPDHKEAMSFAVQLEARHVTHPGRGLEGMEWVEVFWDEAYELIRTHRAALDNVVGELRQYGTIPGDAVSEIVQIVARGRPRIIESPEEMTRLLDEYFESCDEEGKPVTLTGMILHLGLSNQSFDGYGNRPEFVWTVGRAKLIVGVDYEERLWKG